MLGRILTIFGPRGHSKQRGGVYSRTGLLRNPVRKPDPGSGQAGPSSGRSIANKGGGLLGGLLSFPVIALLNALTMHF